MRRVETGFGYHFLHPLVYQGLLVTASRTGTFSIPALTVSGWTHFCIGARSSCGAVLCLGEGGCWSPRALPQKFGGLSLGFVTFPFFFLVSRIKTTLYSRQRSNWHRIESFRFYLINVLANLLANALWGNLRALITSPPRLGSKVNNSLYSRTELGELCRKRVIAFGAGFEFFRGGSKCWFHPVSTCPVSVVS